MTQKVRPIKWNQPVPNTAVEVEGLSIWELCTTSTMVGDGSWLAGSIWGWLCWVGCTNAVAWVCCWTVKMGWERDVWTLGLVERTDPLVLPKTGTCSTGPSDCIAERQTVAHSTDFILSSTVHFLHFRMPWTVKLNVSWIQLTLLLIAVFRNWELMHTSVALKSTIFKRDAGTMKVPSSIFKLMRFQGKSSIYVYCRSLYYPKMLTFLSLHLCCRHNCGSWSSGRISNCSRSNHWTDTSSWSRLIPSYCCSSHFTRSWHNRCWLNICCWWIWSASTERQDSWW